MTLLATLFPGPKDGVFLYLLSSRNASLKSTFNELNIKKINTRSSCQLKKSKKVLTDSMRNEKPLLACSGHRHSRGLIGHIIRPLDSLRGTLFTFSQYKKALSNFGKFVFRCAFLLL